MIIVIRRFIFWIHLFVFKERNDIGVSNNYQNDRIQMLPAFYSHEHIARFYANRPPPGMGLTDMYSELLTIAEAGRCHQPIKPINGRNYCDAFRDETKNFLYLWSSAQMSCVE
jgi:hypothetical protein